MIYKETIEICMDFNDEEIQEEIQNRHKDGWVLTSRIGINDFILGNCAQLTFQRWHEQFNNKVAPNNPVIYGVPHEGPYTVKGVVQ